MRKVEMIGERSIITVTGIAYAWQCSLLPEMSRAERPGERKNELFPLPGRNLSRRRRRGEAAPSGEATLEGMITPFGLYDPVLVWHLTHQNYSVSVNNLCRGSYHRAEPAVSRLVPSHALIIIVLRVCVKLPFFKKEARDPFLVASSYKTACNPSVIFYSAGDVGPYSPEDSK